MRIEIVSRRRTEYGTVENTKINNAEWLNQLKGYFGASDLVTEIDLAVKRYKLISR